MPVVMRLIATGQNEVFKNFFSEFGAQIVELPGLPQDLE